MGLLITVLSAGPAAAYSHSNRYGGSTSGSAGDLEPHRCPRRECGGWWRLLERPGLSWWFGVGRRWVVEWHWLLVGVRRQAVAGRGALRGQRVARRRVVADRGTPPVLMADTASGGEGSWTARVPPGTTAYHSTAMARWPMVRPPVATTTTVEPITEGIIHRPR